MGKIYDIAIRQYVQNLSQEGDRIIRECVQERTYEHQTKNLYDSYGWCVYVKGEPKRRGYLSNSPEAKKGKRWGSFDGVTGRGSIDSFFENYKASKGIELVIAAAMPYGVILEQGAGNLKRKYRVISMSYQKLKMLAPKYGGYVKGLTRGYGDTI